MALQKAEMDKAKTKKANADKGNEKKTMKDKVLEKEFKLVRSPSTYTGSTNAVTWHPSAHLLAAPVLTCSPRCALSAVAKPLLTGETWGLG